MSPEPPRVLNLPCGAPILHHGPAAGPQLLVLQPLFEEMNRCRALVSALCRSLCTRGIGCWLPDLPGSGESEQPLEVIAWADWTRAVDDSVALIGREAGQAPVGTVALRGGALLDAPAARRWRLSPVTGASLVTDLRRSGLLASGAYALGEALSEPLSAAEPRGEARTIRLAEDDRPCDRQIDGPTLWRRPEPHAAPDLAAALADDIAAWIVA